MENSVKYILTEEWVNSYGQWLNSKKRDFNTGLNLLKETGYKPHVVTHIENGGASDGHAVRALEMELRNCLRDLRKEARTAAATVEEAPQEGTEEFTGNIEKELQKEYPALVKRVLLEFQSLYQSRSILHRELKAIGESNDEESTGKRKRQLTVIEALSHRMDVLWEIFDRYKKDGSLPEDAFFDQPFDPEKETAGDQPDPGDSGFVLPDDLEELKKLKENLRIKITKAENRLEYQSEKKEEKPDPMPEGPKRAGLLKKIEEMKGQKEAVEYKIVEMK
ncbi:MAG: hypothetical protein LBI65_04655 [Candidatus Symbiothrix sp.]|jgi:hypothetical protein|nr:hypothetical protein [Candidatus Symbiothrix sp.]